jgi:hypothetical protein
MALGKPHVIPPHAAVHLFVEGLFEFPDGELTVVRPFPLGISVMYNQAKAEAASSCGVLQHLHTAVRELPNAAIGRRPIC